MKTLLVLAHCLFLLIAGEFSRAAANVPGPELVDVRVGTNDHQIERIVVGARNARLARILDEISTRTGVRVHYSDLSDDLVTASCAGASVRQVTDCLLGYPANVVVRYTSSKAIGDDETPPAELWLLGRSRIRGHRVKSSLDSGEQASVSGPAGRARAIGRMIAEGRSEDNAYLATLTKAMSDPEAEVRAQAVFGLARRGGQEALEALRQALRDDDASVRLMAVDNAGTDDAGLALLRDALVDGDETVRALAELKLLHPEASAAGKQR